MLGWDALMAVFRCVNAGCTAARAIASGAACCFAMRLTAVDRFTALNSGKSLSTTASTACKTLLVEAIFVQLGMIHRMHA